MIPPKSIVTLTKPIAAQCFVGFTAPFSDCLEIKLPAGSELKITPGSLRCNNYSAILLHDKNSFEEKHLSNYMSDLYFAGYSFEIEFGILESSSEVIEAGDISSLDLSDKEDQAIFLYTYREGHLEKLPKSLQSAFDELDENLKSGFITQGEWYNMAFEIFKAICSPFIIQI